MGFYISKCNYGRRKNDIERFRGAYKVKLWLTAWGCGRGPSGRRLWVKMNYFKVTDLFGPLSES